MAGSTDNATRHVLIVTGPERDRLYRRFAALFAGHDDVEVMVDRRFGERRRDARGPRDFERRSGDRRRRPPEWIVPPS
jgi:hypothetical protein